jgi:hypothetical protein
MDGWTDKLVTVHGSHPSHPPSRNQTNPIRTIFIEEHKTTMKITVEENDELRRL